MLYEHSTDWRSASAPPTAMKLTRTVSCGSRAKPRSFTSPMKTRPTTPEPAPGVAIAVAGVGLEAGVGAAGGLWRAAVNAASRALFISDSARRTMHVAYFSVSKLDLPRRPQPVL